MHLSFLTTRCSLSKNFLIYLLSYGLYLLCQLRSVYRTSYFDDLLNNRAETHKVRGNAVQKGLGIKFCFVQFLQLKTVGFVEVFVAG